MGLPGAPGDRNLTIMDKYQGHLLASLPVKAEDEQFNELLRGGRFRLERIVSEGHASPPGFWYDQPEGEWVILLQGRTEVLIEGEDKPRLMEPGDYLHIPTGVRHRVEWTDPQQKSVWLALHYQRER